MVPEKKIAFSKKVAKFHIFFSEKNFQDRFFSEKIEIALPPCKWAPRNSAKHANNTYFTLAWDTFRSFILK